jgi:hypothetical protein
VPYREGRFGKPGTWTLMNALEAAGTKVIRGEWANNLAKADFEARSRALLREARAARSHVLFTSYTAGTTAPSTAAAVRVVTCGNVWRGLCSTWSSRLLIMCL